MLVAMELFHLLLWHMDGWMDGSEEQQQLIVTYLRTFSFGSIIVLIRDFIWKRQGKLLVGIGQSAPRKGQGQSCRQ